MADSGDGVLNNRREVRAANAAGALPPVGMGERERERAYPGQFNFEELVQSLRELFEDDRRIASQPDSTRCGICYLHFPLSELLYRDEGFYVCQRCNSALGNQKVHIIKRQQKL